MNPSENHTHRIGRCRLLHGFVFVVAMVSLTLNGENARAASVSPSDYRVATAGDKFDNTWQYAVAFKLRPPRRLRARHLELAVGTLSSPSENTAYVSIGPVWRLPIKHQSFFVELGLSPTLLSGSSINGRDLRGNIHFTSSAALGAAFGRHDNVSVTLRIQHTSNGGLRNTNPGLDMIGLNFALNFANRSMHHTGAKP